MAAMTSEESVYTNATITVVPVSTPATWEG